MKHSHVYLSLEPLSGVSLTHGVLTCSWAQKSARWAKSSSRKYERIAAHARPSQDIDQRSAKLFI